MNCNTNEMRTSHRINKISFGLKDNYVMYSDTDINSDYFNAYTIGVQHTIDWLRKGEGANTIVIDCDGNDSRYDKRASKIAKATGYKVQKTIEPVTGMDGNKWTRYGFILTK